MCIVFEFSINKFMSVEECLWRIVALINFLFLTDILNLHARSEICLFSFLKTKQFHWKLKEHNSLGALLVI